MSGLGAALTGVYVTCCVALIGLVLIQRGEGGVGSAFGGQAVERALGTQAAALWRRGTGLAAGGFVVLALVLGELYGRGSVVR